MTDRSAVPTAASIAKDGESRSLEETIPETAVKEQEYKAEDEWKVSDGEDGPLLSFPLEEDVVRKDHLFSVRTKTPEPTPTKSFRPSEQQLLQQGKLGESTFSARIKKVQFGRYTSATEKRVPACLILVRVHFIPKNTGWFRFRDATVEIAFTDGKTKAEEDDDDDDDDDDYDGPLILKYYPELVRGHTQSLSDQLDVSLKGPTASLSASAGVTHRWAREGLHLVHGWLMGEPETRVKWKMHENEVVKGGIYDQPMLAVLVRHRQGEPLTMALKIKATTYGGLAVTGKEGSRITFKPGKSGMPGKQPVMAGLSGGTVQMGDQTWGVTQGISTEPAEENLEALDLEALTGMKEALLGPQGPGSASKT